MKKLLLLFLISTTAFAGTLRNNKSQQFLSGLVSRNYVLNSGAEQNVNSVTLGATMVLTRTTVTPIEGDAEFTVDGAATSDTADWVSDTFQAGVENRNCLAQFVYQGDASKYTARVRQGGSNIASVALASVTDPTPVQLFFNCGDPADANLLRIENTGTAGAAFRMDSVYLGLAPADQPTPPTVQRFLSGSSATYTLPAGVLWIKVRMLGAGGGGAGSGTSAGSATGSGGNSSFGSLTANGGSGGSFGPTSGGAAGGSCTVGGTWINVASLQGNRSFPGQTGIAGNVLPGGTGGAGVFGGQGSSSNNAAIAVVANSGSGGAGAGFSGAGSSGSGGGAGCYLEAIQRAPDPTYTYTVGSPGSNAGGAGASGTAGGVGAEGIIVVEEHY